jgi:transcriptional regulator with XRE-family HTH domain
MNLKEIGNLIIKRREFLNLRQSDLAEKTLNQIEQGNGNPSFKTLNKVVEVLGLELNLKVKEVS